MGSDGVWRVKPRSQFVQVTAKKSSRTPILRIRPVATLGWAAALESCRFSGFPRFAPVKRRRLGGKNRGITVESLERLCPPLYYSGVDWDGTPVVGRHATTPVVPHHPARPHRQPMRNSLPTCPVCHRTPRSVSVGVRPPRCTRPALPVPHRRWLGCVVSPGIPPRAGHPNPPRPGDTGPLERRTARVPTRHAVPPRTGSRGDPHALVRSRVIRFDTLSNTHWGN